MFNEKLKTAMQQLELNQAQVSGLTGKSKPTICMYLSGKLVPPETVQKGMAVELGLARDYFEEERPVEVAPKGILKEAKIEKVTPKEVADLMGMTCETVRKGLQQGVFPWGYAIRTSKNRWTYFINAKRFIEIEKIGK